MPLLTQVAQILLFLLLNLIHFRPAHTITPIHIFSLTHKMTTTLIHQITPTRPSSYSWRIFLQPDLAPGPITNVPSDSVPNATSPHSSGPIPTVPAAEPLPDTNVQSSDPTLPLLGCGHREKQPNTLLKDYLVH